MQYCQADADAAAAFVSGSASGIPGDTQLLPAISFHSGLRKGDAVTVTDKTGTILAGVEYEATPAVHPGPEPESGHPRSTLKISNPLASLWKGKEPSGPPARLLMTTGISNSSTSTSTASSTTDLAHHMANMSVQDPKDIVIPPTANGHVAFLQHLTKLLNAGTTTTVSQATTEKNTKADMPTNQVASRAMEKNLCCIDWMEDNLTGTSRQFDNYWKKLSAMEKEQYNQRLRLVKMAKNSIQGRTVLATIPPSLSSPSQVMEEPIDNADKEDSHPILAGI
ncbi:hypothetical protein BS17DRAFT_763915 [Gyrodon lividus]|nr:hypothetical protein BS17DRAFT_763915 [Gyrodon lividus]